MTGSVDDGAEDFTLRCFLPADAEALPGIYVAAVRQLARRVYDADQVRVWQALAPSADAFRAAYGDGRVALVVADAADRPVGFADLEPDGHIQFLYLHPRAAGRGLAGRLLARLEAEARRQGLARIFAEASEAALPVFQRAGFHRLHRRALDIDGVPIHNHAVEKRLAPAGRAEPGPPAD